MFGRIDLMRDGIATNAVVISCKGEMGGSVRDKGSGEVYHLELKVHFNDGSSAVVKQRMGDSLIFLPPSPGELIPVRYDPNDHKRVEIDRPKIKAHNAARDSDRARNDQIRIARAEAKLTGAANSVTVGSSHAAGTLDRLRELADLHSSGALTDAEFAAAKSKILAEG